jgi:hypothetical protein
MATEPNSSDFATGNPSLGRKAADVADQGRSAAAAGLSAAAGAVNDTAEEGANRVKRAAQRTATALSSGADYIRDNSVQDMISDALDVVKNNPGAALLGAVAVGFLIGRAAASRN